MKRFVYIVSAISLLLIVIVIIFLNLKKNESRKEMHLLSNRPISEIKEIHIINQFDNYSVYEESGGFRIADLPMDLVNPEYLLMMLDEASKVEYEEIVCEIEGSAAKTTLASYGLDKPPGIVTVHFNSGEEFTVIFGSAEPVSGGQYFMVQGKNTVYLMNHSRVVRFLQPLKRFINFEIVPVRSAPSPLSTIKSLTLSGRSLRIRLSG